MTWGSKNALNLFRAHIVSEKILKLLESCLEDESNADIQRKILEDAPFYGRFKNKNDWNSFVEAALAIAQSDAGLKDIFSQLYAQISQKIQDNTAQLQANHQEKRDMIQKLGIRKHLGMILVLINAADSFEQASRDIFDHLGVTLILRGRSYPRQKKNDFLDSTYHDFERGCILVEQLFCDTPESAILCTAENGFLIINPEQSVIIISGKKGDYKMELVVMRNIPQDSDYAEPLLQWLQEVIKRACAVRHDVRPGHPGKMVQIGLNMGARHAQILGWAKSFTQNLTAEQLFHDDSDLLGAMSLFWALVKANLPQDIIKPVQDRLNEGFPTMATRNIPEGYGFSITIGGVDYTFNEASRAPPEGIATAAYSSCAHTDLCSLKWAFAWIVGHFEPSPAALPQNKGANFVDLGLQTVVETSPGTLIAFQPESLHGTTETRGVENYILALPFIRQVYDAYMELEKKGAKIEFGLPLDQHYTA